MDRVAGNMIIATKPLVTLIIYFTALTILVLLGTWQLVRGLEKAEIERKLGDTDLSTRISASTDNWSTLEYVRAELSGNWLEGHDFLLENRIHQGRPGYELFTPFELAEDSTVLLINRGWMENPEDGSPIIPTGDPNGILYRPEPGFTLGSALSGEMRWPQTVLYLDIPVLSVRFGRELEPAVLVLDPSHQAAHVSLWKPTSMSASRHYGYAVQWWGLALVLLIMGFVWQRSAAERSPS